MDVLKSFFEINSKKDDVTHRQYRDGLWFEKVVSELLNAGVGDLEPCEVRWIHLSPDGGPDGSRDFERQHNGRKEWAEAKNHKGALSLKQLGPTLIVAKNEEVKRILIFSASPLTEVAERQISLYGAATNIRVDVFQDKGLERIILQRLSDDIFHQLFSTVKPPHSALSLTGLSLWAHFAGDPDIDYTDEGWQGKDKPRKPHPVMSLDLGEVICLDIFLINRDSADPCSGRLSVQPGSLGVITKSFRECGGLNELDLQPGEVKSFRLHLQAIRGSPEHPLPAITWTDAKTGETRNIQTNFNSYKVMSFLQPPIVGETHIGYLANVKDALSKRVRASFLGIYGRSGTGKSRLLQAIRNTALEEQRPVFLSHGDSGHLSNGVRVLRDFVSKRFKIPPLGDLPDFAQESGELWKPRTLVDRILFDPEFDLERETEACARLLADELKKCNGVLIVDNVQSFGDGLSKVLLALLELSKDAGHDFVVAVSFNLDFTPVGAAAMLLLRLREASDGLESPVICTEIGDFSEADACLLIDNCLVVQGGEDQRFSHAFPKTTRLLLGRIRHRPLDMLHALRLMEERGVACRQVPDSAPDGHGRLYVRDLDGFHRALGSLPKKIEEILNLRWRHYGSLPGVEAAARAAAFFLRISEDDLQSFPDVTDEACARMIDSGIFRSEGGGSLVLEHRIVRDYLAGKLKIENTKFLRSAITFLEATGLEQSFRAQYLAAKAMVRKAGLVELEELARLIAANKIPVELYGFCATAWGNRLQAKGPTGLELIIRLLPQVCDAMNRNLGFDKSSYLFEQLFPVPALLTEQMLERIDAAAYTEVAILFSSNLIRLRRDGEALDLLLSCVDLMPRLPFSSNIDRLMAEAYLSNRLCVTYRSLNDLRQARRHGLNVCRIGRMLKVPALRKQGLIDLGYTFENGYTSATEAERDRSRLRWLWGAAVAEHPEDTIKERIAVTHRRVFLFHRAHVLVLNEQYDEARKLIDDVIDECWRVLDIFFLVKLSLLYVLTRVIDETLESNWEYCRGLLNRALDLCQAYRANQSYWLAFYLRAICVEFRSEGNDWRERDQDVTNALEQLVLSLGDRGALYFRFKGFFAQAVEFLARNPQSDLCVRGANIVRQIPDIRISQPLLEFISDPRAGRTAGHSVYMKEGYVLPCP
jgi:hypothetical protein